MQTVKISTQDDLSDMLRFHGIDCTAWQKTVADLFTELTHEDCTLMIDANGKLVRILNVLYIIIVNEKNQVLVEKFQILPSGRKRERNLLVAEKHKPSEDIEQAIARTFAEELSRSGNSGDAVHLHVTYHIINGSLELFMEPPKPSPSYPGLLNACTNYVVKVMATGLPLDDFQTFEERPTGVQYNGWHWVAMDDAVMTIDVLKSYHARRCHQ